MCVNEDLERLDGLRNAVIRLQVVVEGLSEKHRGGRELRVQLEEMQDLLGKAKGKRREQSSAHP